MIHELPTRQGICTTAGCAVAERGPVDLYDGPGRYCPECGEALKLVTRSLRVATVPPPVPRRRRWSYVLGAVALVSGVATGFLVVRAAGGDASSSIGLTHTAGAPAMTHAAGAPAKRHDDERRFAAVRPPVHRHAAVARHPNTAHRTH